MYLSHSRMPQSGVMRSRSWIGGSAIGRLDRKADDEPGSFLAVELPDLLATDGPAGADRFAHAQHRGEVRCLDTQGFYDGKNDGPYTKEDNENKDEADVIWVFDMMKELGALMSLMNNKGKIQEELVKFQQYVAQLTAEGMSGGGMGFIFDPRRKLEAQDRLQTLMLETKRELQHALPFAMDPVVFDYAINENGTFADLLCGEAALMPPGYYALIVPALLRQDRHELPAARRTELDKFGAAARTRPELRGMVQVLFDALLPRGRSGRGGAAAPPTPAPYRPA